MGGLEISMQILEGPCSNLSSKAGVQRLFLQSSHTCLPDIFSFIFLIAPIPTQVSGIF
jgi:hypothetical protein